MWNEQTKTLVAEGKLVVLGVVQEQHAQRAQLYKQWKQYSFPIAQDSITGLGLAVVPVPILIDEHGFVMKSRLRPNNIAQLVNQNVKPPQDKAPVLNPQHMTTNWLRENATSNPSPESLIALGDAFLRSKSLRATREAIKWYRKSLPNEGDENPANLGIVNFRLGVAFRRLFDLCSDAEKDPKDFSRASAAWSRALAQNPNQYIWRRRIQQYGPRQIKPYPFYDWVDQAQTDIAKRGETPIKLSVPLSGAEIAQPNRQFAQASDAPTNPDPESRITKDEENLIQFDATVVPTAVKPGQSVRVHLRFTPKEGKWNNESDEMLVWLNPSDSGQHATFQLSHPNAKTAASTEPRSVEFEFKTSADAKSDIELSGYVLYYVCKTEEGQCIYMRQDFKIPLKLN